MEPSRRFVDRIPPTPSRTRNRTFNYSFRLASRRVVLAAKCVLMFVFPLSTACQFVDGRGGSCATSLPSQRVLALPVQELVDQIRLCQRIWADGGAGRLMSLTARTECARVSRAWQSARGHCANERAIARRTEHEMRRRKMFSAVRVGRHKMRDAGQRSRQRATAESRCATPDNDLASA